MRNLSFILGLFLLYSCSNKEQALSNTSEDYYQITGEAQGTTYSILYKDAQGRNFKQNVDSLLAVFDQSLSTYIPGSQISRFNESDSLVFIDPTFIEMLQHAWFVYNETNGAFDPTINPLLSFWGFNKENIAEPDSIDSSLIKEALNKSGFEKIFIQKKSQLISVGQLNLSSSTKGGYLGKKDPYIQLNFNAIAQGFSVDLLGRLLTRKGIENFMIELGGETLIKGNNPNGNPWRMGVDKPVEGERQLNAIIHLTSGGLASSGNYRKYYLKKGKKYAHTIDPRTGYPVEHNLLSATVLASTCWEADGFATACMVNGPEWSKNLAKENSEIEVFLVFQEGEKLKTYFSKGLEEKIELLE